MFAHPATMPHTIRVSPASRSALIRVTGTVDGAGIIAACRELFTHPDWEPGFSTLWDALGVSSLLLAPEDLGAFGAEAEELMALRGPGRSAVVATDVDTKLNALVYAAKSRDSVNRSVRLFDDVVAATAWVAEGAGERVRAA